MLILDSNNVPFYFRENLKRNQRFNMPVGTYYSNGNLIELDKPVFYSKPKLKNRYTFRKYPEQFKISYGYNPNKCTVNLSTNEIFFDNEFLGAPQFVTEFIKFHELGHYRYSDKGQLSERECDNFAAYSMLVLGYNPTQIRVAIKYSLSNTHLGKDRKRQNFNYLKSIKSL